MRQVGTLPTEAAARRFAAWLIAQRIDAQAEQEAAGWMVWVRDEDKLSQAREEYTHFRDHPDDAKYQNAEKAADALLRDDVARRRQAQGNVVQMRGRWGNTPGAPGMRRRAPVTMFLIIVSAIVALLTWPDTMNEPGSKPEFGGMYRALLFVDPFLALSPQQTDHEPHLDMWASLRRGELWRLVTPIFIHYGLMHIIFNMMMLHSFGSVLEDRRGTLFMLLLVLAIAIFSDVGQALETSVRGLDPRFGGMSGVCFGLLGYVYIKSRFDNREGYYLAPGTTILAIGWLVLGVLHEIPPFSQILGALPSMANSAHIVGLLTGAAIAYAPLVARKPA